MTPGESRLEDVDAWIVSAGLSGSTERLEDDLGTTILARSANPAGVLAGPVRLLTIIVTNNKVTSSRLTDVPLNRPVTDELGDLVALLGVPEHIFLVPALGDYPLGYTLRLVYRVKGLEVMISGIADQAEISGVVEDALCLGKYPLREVDILLYDQEYYPLTTSDLNWDWAKGFGVDEKELLSWMIDTDRCLPIP